MIIVKLPVTQPNTTAYAAQDASSPIVTFEENSLILAEAGFRTAGFAKGLDTDQDLTSWSKNPLKSNFFLNIYFPNYSKKVSYLSTVLNKK